MSDADWEDEPESVIRRREAEKNLKRAMEHRAECRAQEEYAKDQIAYFTAELVKAERLLERMADARPSADDLVRESFDFYRSVMESQ